MRTYSLNLRRRGLLRAIIRASERTPLGPSMTPQMFELGSGSDGLASGEAEYADHARFFRHFHGRLSPSELAGKRLLDVGCGYGGRTVYYAECGAEAHGIEIYEEVVRRCRQLAERKDSSATFSLAFAEELPFESDLFDVVLSYDVLEHVNDPEKSIAEMVRVLRPGGLFLAVFPTYKGARASHLDYLTRVPFLHRIFDPAVIVEVVNEFLVDPRYGPLPQPAPQLTPLGVLPLPGMNGMTLRDARRLLAPVLQIDEEIITPIVDPQLDLAAVREQLGGSLVLAAPVRAVSLALAALPALPDLLIQNIAVRARKP